MSLAAPIRIEHPFPSLLVLPALALVLVVLLPPLPAFAHEKVFGPVVVRSGEVEDSVSTSFGNVTVDGVVRGEVRSGFGNVRVNNEVGGDISTGFGDIRVNAPVGGGVETDFGDVYVNSLVRGDVVVDRGEVTLGPNAHVLGNVICPSGKIQSERGARIEGAQIFGMAARMEESSERESGILGFLGWMLATLVFVASCVLLAVIAPRPLHASARRVEDSPWWSLLFGVVSVPVAVILSVALAVSVVGIPVLLLLAPAYLALLFFGALVAAYFVGRGVLFATGRYRGGDALAAVVGALLVAAAYTIPFIGKLTLYTLALLGTGAAILALFSRRRSRIV